MTWRREGAADDGSGDAEHVGGFGFGSVAGVGVLERNVSTKIHGRFWLVRPLMSMRKGFARQAKRQAN